MAMAQAQAPPLPRPLTSTLSVDAERGHWPSDSRAVALSAEAALTIGFRDFVDIHWCYDHDTIVFDRGSKIFVERRRRPMPVFLSTSTQHKRRCATLPVAPAGATPSLHHGCGGYQCSRQFPSPGQVRQARRWCQNSTTLVCWSATVHNTHSRHPPQQPPHTTATTASTSIGIVPGKSDVNEIR